MAIRYERMAALVGVETTYGVDPTPTDGVWMRDVSIDTVQGDQVEFGVLRPGMGGRIKRLFGRRVNLKAKFPICGSGTAGTPPAWDAIARACAHAATVTEDTKVEYAPIDTGFESASIYFNCEGNRTVMLGARGNIIWRWAAGQFPEAEIDLTGLWSSDASVAYPSVSYAAWNTPLLVGKDTVPLFQLNSVDEVMQSLEINAGVVATYVERVNRRDVEIADRIARVTAVIEEPAFSSRNHFSLVAGTGNMSLALTHGLSAGAKILATATFWRLDAGQRQQLGNNLGVQIAGDIRSSSGTPDYVISVQ